MTPAQLIDVMVADFKKQLNKLKVRVYPHAGKFTWAELKARSYTAPALFISCLGWREDTRDQINSVLDGKAYRVRFAAGIVTSSVKNAETRNAQARQIATTISLHLDDQDWAQDDVTEATDLRAEGLFNREAEADNQSMWLLDWWHGMSFDADDVLASLNDFLTAHGDHYTAEGNYTDAQGAEIPVASDTTTIPQS